MLGFSVWLKTNSFDNQSDRESIASNSSVHATSHTQRLTDVSNIQRRIAPVTLPLESEFRVEESGPKRASRTREERACESERTTASEGAVSRAFMDDFERTGIQARRIHCNFSTPNQRGQRTAFATEDKNQSGLIRTMIRPHDAKCRRLYANRRHGRSIQAIR